MKARKRVSQLLLCVIAFSFAAGTPYASAGFDTSGSLPSISEFVSDKGSDEYDEFTDGTDLQKDETAALKNWRDEDLCDRTSADGGISHPTFLGILFKLVGDADGTNIKEDVTVTDIKDAKIQPEDAFRTKYECWPQVWRDKYSSEDWKNYQRGKGVFDCGTLDVSCHIEEAVRGWVSDAIRVGLTWIMNIATGSGSGTMQACRLGADQVTDVNGKTPYNDIRTKFTREDIAACDKALDDYYALGQNNTTLESHHAYAIGLKAEPKTEDGKYDAPLVRGTGDTSINSDSAKVFFSKSANIGMIIAVAMLIGAVIQSMIQQKPQLLFRVIIIQIPLFGIALVAAPILVKDFMAFVDGVSYYLASTSQNDINNVANSVGMSAGNISEEATGAVIGIGGAVKGGAVLVNAGVGATALPLAGGLLMSLGQGILLIFGIVGIIFLMQVLGLWALMQFREASILLVYAVLPLSLSASIWPALTRTANKFIKLLVSLIVAKIPIVMALSMGLHLLSEWAVDPNHGADVVIRSGDSSGNRVLILGMAIFGLAFVAPTFIITLFDAIGEMGGSLASRMHTGAGRSALMYSSQAAGLKGVLGAATGGHFTKARKQVAEGKGSSPAGGKQGLALPTGGNQSPGGSGPSAGGSGPSAGGSGSGGSGSGSGGSTPVPGGAGFGVPSKGGSGSSGPSGPSGSGSGGSGSGSGGSASVPGGSASVPGGAGFGVPSKGGSGSSGPSASGSGGSGPGYSNYGSLNPNNRSSSTGGKGSTGSKLNGPYGQTRNNP